MKKYWNLFTNPFVRIAGIKALGWGFAGMLLSTLLCMMSGQHYNGLLQFAPFGNDYLWNYLCEHLIIWLIPAAIFYLGGLLLSRSRPRISDVLGTVLFAQLPLLFVNVTAFFPVMQSPRQLGPNPNPQEVLEMMQGMNQLAIVVFGLLVLLTFAWMFIWMFRALQVSCNLKGFRLWAVYLTAILVGDMLCRIIIAQVSTL